MADTVILDVRPGAGIGPIEIGMARADAVAAALASGLEPEDFRRTLDSAKPNLAISGQLFTYFDGDGHVEEVEVGVGGPLPVACLGIDLA